MPDQQPHRGCDCDGCPTSSAGALSIAWVGPTTGPCASLLKRIEQQCQLESRQLQLYVQATLSLSQLSSCQRILLASPTRPEYPRAAIDQLSITSHGIPWGVVTDHWYAGSRRSELGITTHWMQPWYRWWESWYGWLFPHLARPGGLPTNLFDAISLPSDLATSQLASSDPALERDTAEDWPTLTLISACNLTAQAWRQMAHRANWQSIQWPWSMTEAGLLIIHERGSTMPASVSTPMAAQLCASRPYVMWDDSLLSCWPGLDVHSQLHQQLAEVRNAFPEAIILAGLSQSYFDLYPALLAQGVSEIFIKPSYGLPLADYLHALRTRNQ